MTRVPRLLLKATRPLTLMAWWPALTILLVPAGLCRAAEEPKPPRSCSEGAPIDYAPHRTTVRHNYIEIVYDAQTREVWWIDREGIRGKGPYIPINENSVFAPVTFAKERIIVTICNAKFNTDATTSVVTTVIPESGLDVRQVSAALAAVSTQAAREPAKEPAAPGGPPAKPKTAKEYAQMALSYFQTFERLKAEMEALRCPKEKDEDKDRCPLDSVTTISKRAIQIYDGLVKALSAPPPPSPPPNSDPALLQAPLQPKNNQAQFDSFTARTKSLVDSLNNMAATVAAGDYLNRATALAAQYSDLAALKVAKPKKGEPEKEDAAEDAAGAEPKPEEIPELKLVEKLAQDANQNLRNTNGDAKKISQATADICASLLAVVGAMDLKLDAGQNLQAATAVAQRAETNLLSVQAGQQGPANDDQKGLARALLEAATIVRKAAKSVAEKAPTWAEINAELKKYLPDVKFETIVADDQPFRLFEATSGLTGELNSLHDATSKIFNGLNKWREDSRVTLTSVVTPPKGNAVLTVRIILHETYAPFTFGAPPKKDATPDSTKPSTGTITASAVTGSAPEQHEVRRVLVEVHRKADANLVGAIIGSTIPVRAFGLQPGPPMTTPNGPVVPYYAYESQNDHVQIQGIAGINWYPGGRDFYPGYLRGVRRLIPGILFGTSVTAPGNFVGGLDFEPVNGFDIILGGEVGPVTQLAQGVALGQTPSGGPYFASGDTIPTHQRLTGGFVFGIGFDLSVFSAVFSGGSAPSSSPAPTPTAH